MCELTFLDINRDFLCVHHPNHLQSYDHPNDLQQRRTSANPAAKGNGSWGRGCQGNEGQGGYDDDEDDGHLVGDEDDLVDDDYCDCQEGEGEGDKIRWSLVLGTCTNFAA